MFNIKREGREDLLLGCSVPTEEECERWLKYYRQRYRQFTYYMVMTDYAGDMAGITIDINMSLQ